MNKNKNIFPSSTTYKFTSYITVGLLFVFLLSSCKNNEIYEKFDDKYGTYYEIFVASFYDSNNDGMGDIQGMIKKLDYLNDANDTTTKDLMIDGIWLMPIMPSPSYHKYDVTDYKSIAPEYGTMEDFQKFLSLTKERDIDVIIDFVVNHSSVEHPWFKEAIKGLEGSPNKYTNYYNFTKSSAPHYHEVPTMPGYYYEGAFGPHMPDLNLDNEDVRKEILDIAKFWLDMGVDGFRLDAVIHFYNGNTSKNTAFLSWFYEEVKLLNEDVYVVGEAWSDGGTIDQLYESGIDSFFNFTFADSSGKIAMNLRSKNGYALAKSLESWKSNLSAKHPTSIDAVFLSNHDNSRSANALMRKLPLQKMGASLYQLIPGNAFIYYGEEIGMLGSGKDENKRQPFLWSTSTTKGIPNPPIGSDDVSQDILPLDEQLEEESSLVQHYIDLARIKKTYPEIMRGDLTAIDLSNDALCAYEIAWKRPSTTKESSIEKITIIHNFGDATLPIDLSSVPGDTVVEMLPCDDEKPTVTDHHILLPPKTSVLIK